MRFDTQYTKEYLDEIIAATLKVAPIIYKTKARNIWHLEDMDDFIQEALIHMLKLFDTRYINPLDKDKGTTQNLVSSLLSGTFLLNRYNVLTRDRYNGTLKLELNDSQDPDNTTRTIGVISESSIETTDLTPQDQFIIDTGKETIYNILDTLDKDPVKTRKYTYSGYEETLGTLELSEHTLFRLVLLGYGIQDIVELYGLDNSSVNISRANYVRKILTQTIDKVAKIVETLDPGYVDAIEKYLETI